MAKNKGFTLVELMIVIAVLSVLLGMVLIAIDPQKVIEDTKDSRARAEMNQLKTALQLYFNDNNAYPEGTCNGDGCRTGILATALVPTYIKALPDVVGGSFEFFYQGETADYDAGINLNNAVNDDNNTVAKCRPPETHNYMICPD